MKGGEEERLITDGEEKRIYMRAVRGSQGRVIGYYERYEAVEKEKPGDEKTNRPDSLD